MAAALPLQSQPLKDFDPELNDIIEHEKTRQWKGIELIASENFTSRAVLDALGTCLTNKYSEGLPGSRYYGGNEYIDMIENLCIKRALTAFHLNANEWAVNVQPYSGSPANFEVYNAILQPHDRFMGLDLPSGGHLTHGFYTAKKKISATSTYFESLPYHLNANTGYIDYDNLEQTAMVFRPKLIVCGGSAYPREFDYARLRKIADKVEAMLMCDMAHFSGLVAAQVLNNPFAFCDIVTTTTHKTLRGPRGAIIFCKKDARKLDEKINFSVFPSMQGGPHNNVIAGIATQLKEVASPEYTAYAKQVVANAQALGKALAEMGHKLITDGTDNHLLLWDLRPHKLSGSKFEGVCDVVSITLNKNTIYGDVNAVSPGGVRIGTPAMTSRGFKEADFVKVAQFLDRALKAGVRVNDSLDGGKPTLAVYKAAIKEDAELLAIKKEVEAFSTSFYMPGFDVATLTYRS